ncbi:MAG: OmpH family outer membrane protein [Planctomycetota bacterium]
MKNPMAIVALCGALVLGLYVTAGGQAGGEAQTNKVAVVNLEEVIRNCQQQAVVRASNQALAEELKAEQQRRQQEIATLTTQIDPLQPGTEAWNNKRDELEAKTIELQVWAQATEQKNQREQARQFAEIYTAATQATADVAAALGYDIVLQAADLPNIERANVQQLQTIVATRKVVYAGEGADITQAVLARVDANFQP